MLFIVGFSLNSLASPPDVFRFLGLLSGGESFFEECRVNCMLKTTYNATEAENLPATDSRPLVVVTDLFGVQHYSKIEILTDSPYLWAVAHSEKLTPGVYMITSTNKQALFKKTLIIQAQ